VALVGRGVKPEDAKEILEGEKKLSGKFLELILNKEREALLWRFRGRKVGFETDVKPPEHKEN
jgi:rRNA processing protein Krr1/Pno1